MRTRTLASGVALLVACLSVKAQAQAVREARVFDVRHIAVGPLEPLRTLPGAPTIRGDGLRGYERDWEQISFVGVGGLADPSAGSLRLTPKLIREAIQSLMAPDSWSNARNSIISPQGNGASLLVVQTPDVLDRIEALLRRLEARASRTVSLDLALVPPEALADVAPEWRRPGSSPWLPPDALDRAVRASKGRALVASGPIPEGTRWHVSPSRTSAHVVDFVINCTGVLPVRNPVIGTSLEGSFAEALVLGSPSGRWCRVDLVLGRTAQLGEPERRKTELGPIELLAERQSRLETTVIAPAGATVLVGVFHARKAEGAADRGKPESFAALLRVTPPVPEEGTAEGPDLAPAVVEAGLLLEPLRDSRLEPSRDPLSEESQTLEIDFGGDEGGVTLLAPAVLEALLEEAFPADAPQRGRRWRYGGTILLDAEGPRVDAVRRRLEEVARERAVFVVVDLWQGILEEAELEALGSAGAILDESWLARMEEKAESRVRTASLAGMSAALASVASRNYIADIEMLSGGTGYTILEVGDPIVSQVGEGIVLNATASLVPGTDWAQLRVEGEAARRPELRRKTRARQSGGVEVQEGSRPGEEARPKGEPIELDLPEEDADRWQHFVTVPLGRPVFLNALPDGDRPGKTRVLLATVHAFRIEAP